MHNSNYVGVVQLTLEGEPVVVDFVWVFIGIFSADVLDIFDNSWFVELKNDVLSRII